MQRYLHRLLKRAKWADMGIKILMVPILIRKGKPKRGFLKRVHHPIILPTELVGALSRHGLFEKMVLGGLAPRDVLAYWESVCGQPWASAHPVLRDHPSKARIFPFGFHGDDAVFSKRGRKVVVIGWNPTLNRSATKQSRFIFALIDRKLCIKDVTIPMLL
eukprot:5733747-Alexandrium_andersonii.AAC.1